MKSTPQIVLPSADMLYCTKVTMTVGGCPAERSNPFRKRGDKMDATNLALLLILLILIVTKK